MPGCSSCELESVNGDLICVYAGQKDLEFKFEAFPLEAAVVTDAKANESLAVRLSGPVEVMLLETELWFDPTIPTEGATVGSNPVVVGNSAPGQSPPSATAICNYVGAVELRAANGESLMLATGSFPLTLHVGGFYEDSYFERTQYSHVGSEA